MGILDRLLGRKQERPEGEAEVSEPACPHAVVVPHWDSADDMGKPDRVSSYACEACHATFSREEGERLDAAQAERVRKLEAERLDKQ
jgi:transposase-like protein